MHLCVLSECVVYVGFMYVFASVSRCVDECYCVCVCVFFLKNSCSYPQCWPASRNTAAEYLRKPPETLESLRTQTHTHTHTHTHTEAHTCTHTHRSTHMHTCTQMHTHSFMHSHSSSHMRKSVFA